jgi:hypothetical protein
MEFVQDPSRSTIYWVENLLELIIPTHNFRFKIQKEKIYSGPQRGA